MLWDPCSGASKSIHNNCFHGELDKIIPELSLNSLLLTSPLTNKLFLGCKNKKIENTPFTLTIHWASLADDPLIKFFLFFPENNKF